MGGGGGGGTVAPVQAAAEPETATVPVANFAAFAPGQQGLLAQQMQQGYGGLLADHMNAMNFYRDMRAPVIREPGDIANYLTQRGLEPVAGGSKPTPVRDPVTGQVAQTAAPAASAPAPIDYSWRSSGGGRDR